jgi:hypothetical protein
MLAPHSDLEHTDFLNILAGSDTAGAEDTSGHVVLNHHVTRALITAAEREVVMRAGGDLITHDVLLELIAGRGSSTVAISARRESVPSVRMVRQDQVLAGIAFQQEIEDSTPVAHCRVGFSLHHHPFGSGSGARREQLVLSLHRDEANPAVPHDRELGVPAERRDIYPSGPSCFEDGLSGLEGDVGAVQGQARHGYPVKGVDSSLEGKIMGCKGFQRCGSSSA